MKNYNKILEAINRGIKFALDDFEDSDIQGQVNSKVSHQHGTKEYLDLVNETVDLELPSGTLWCKYNLGVNLSLLNTPEDWYGDYYAWGELEPNKTDKDGNIYFYWSNYKFGDEYNLTKYCNDSNFGLNGFTDNLTELQPEDDVAYLTKKLYNFKFHIPSKEQCEELIKYTNNYWVNNYDPNKHVHNPRNDMGIQRLNGYMFEGKNGNQLFIPAAGIRLDLCKFHVGFYCRLWSSSLCLKDCNCAYCLSFNSNIINIYSEERMYGYEGRMYGFSVRPVLNL